VGCQYDVFVKTNFEVTEYVFTSFTVCRNPRVVETKIEANQINRQLLERPTVDRLVGRQPTIVDVAKSECSQPNARHPWLPSQRNLDPLLLVDSVPLKLPFPSFRTVVIETL